MIGNTLAGRYQIINHLGGGGFGETYIACDTQLPSSPQCVVKRLKPQVNNTATLETARRLFDTEAQVLYQLGTHERIPQLLAYFEENAEFYLVQELITGHSLSNELTPGKIFTQDQIIFLLQEILEILHFVHDQKVIHRDVNPRNILRREQDGKLILIDFGAVKQITTQVITSTGETKATVAIGTPGYIPGEQAQGNPKFSSDIYALGIIAIQAITGLLPEQITKDPENHEIIWRKYATVSPEFAQFIDKMVCYDFRQRYASATIALQALQQLNQTIPQTIALAPASVPLNNITSFKISKDIFPKLIFTTIFVALGITISIFIFNRVNTNNATELYKQGITFLQLHRYEEALAVYQEAVNIKPNYSAGWYGQGKALFALKKYPEALIAYDQAIQIQPDYLEAWLNRGFTLVNLQRYSEAISAFDRVLQLEENYPEAWQGKGDTFRKLNQYVNAVKSYEQAINLQPDNYDLWYKKALSLQDIKDYEQAIIAYNKAVELKPDAETAWYNLGNSLVNLNRYEDAFKAYDKAVQYKPNHYLAWLSRGNILMALQRYPEAIVSFREVIKYDSKNYQAWYNQGWLLHQIQRYEEAITSYNQAINLKKNDHLVWYSLGNSQYILQKYQEALSSYNKAVRYQPNHYESWYSRGNVLLNLKQYESAIASYDQALKYKSNYQQAIDARNKAQSQLQGEKLRSSIIPFLRTPR
ncbi:tetratricopeptide repeat protein [Cronbergia sp. UHCC 0137]|uniref:tetratricopeptide repeat protein n=1 Tax=Cronbergia sp. UHCC 0137 TaxID=3110239 RepID=UPI002B1F33C7|nr:tetratricopeptide repeat protein [Cronbergia sp. UHCC 0137]MEA5616332.1 tetratricopeptide repeat protein [Cronbergia sp. UHCC 0137]